MSGTTPDGEGRDQDEVQGPCSFTRATATVRRIAKLLAAVAALLGAGVALLVALGQYATAAFALGQLLARLWG